MRVLSIIKDSIVDGPGLRSTIFFAGCPHYCKGCHNPKSWNENGGNVMTVEEIMKEISSDPLNNITFSGGEPFMQIDELTILARELKRINKNIWCYTGFTWEELQEKYEDRFIELCKYMDVLVDGRFVLAERDLSLVYKGSNNQRIIDCKATVFEGRICSAAF